MADEQQQNQSTNESTVKLRPGQAIVDAEEFQRAKRQAIGRKEMLRKVLGADADVDAANVDEVVSRLAKLAALEVAQKEEEGKYQELILVERTRREAAESKVVETQAAWEHERLSSAVVAAAVQAGAINPEQVVAIYGGSARIVDGKLVEAKSGVDFAAHLAEQAAGAGANLFRAKGRSGAGTPPGGTQSPTVGAEFSNLSPAMQATIAGLRSAGAL